MKTFSIEEVAEKYGVNPESVRRWIRRGELEAMRKPFKPGRPYIITEEDLKKFEKERSVRA